MSEIKAHYSVFPYSAGYFDPTDDDQWAEVALAMVLDGGCVLFDRYDVDAMVRHFLGDDVGDYTTLVSRCACFDLWRVYEGTHEVPDGEDDASFFPDRDASLILFVERVPAQVINEV